MIHAETHTVVLELFDRVNAEIERLEPKIRAGLGSEEEADICCELADVAGIFLWVIQGKPLTAGSLASILWAARVVWNVPAGTAGAV
jgi:hypothetical protein